MRIPSRLAKFREKRCEVGSSERTLALERRYCLSI